MALLPIDLQTLFTQANQVGKDQAVQKEAPPQAQSAQGAQIVQQAEQRDNAVNETTTQEEGPEKVKDAHARGGTGGRSKPSEKGRKSGAPEAAARTSFVIPSSAATSISTG